jgi:hypothetical protein
VAKSPVGLETVVKSHSYFGISNSHGVEPKCSCGWRGIRQPDTASASRVWAEHLRSTITPTAPT